MTLQQIASRRVLPAVFGLALLLSACGGGDPYAGLWRGTMDGNRQVSAMVLGDGSYYMLYSPVGRPGAIAGLVQGSGDFHAARFASVDARNYSWEGLGTRPTTVSGKIGREHSLTGTVGGAPVTVSFDDRANDIPRLATLVGGFGGTAVFALGERPAVFTVTEQGEVSTNINNCPIKGRIAPRMDGDLYDLTITFGGAPCVLPFQTFNGVAVYRAELRRLEAAVVHPLLPQALAFAGTKQQP